MTITEKEKILQLLSNIPDPEIPVISIMELGIVRDVETSDHKANVIITPTYSGCPAMKMIEDDITSLLQENGFKEVQVTTVLSPAWTTDWITDDAKEKLRKYGIAPPEKATVNKSVLSPEGPKKIKCPHCGSENTEMRSQFGSTACKALYVCKDCKEPFDYFKCI